MDNESMNRYEKQLYTVFKTFDVDNEEALDKPAVHALCDALQLEERGAALADSLFERRSGRVTFTQFRNGLLAALGAPAAAETAPPAESPHSDDDSSGREVAPKFVFGSKKYGRRSRPQRAEPPASPARASSASRLDSDDRARRRPQCRRSASAMEARGDGDSDAPDPPGVAHDRRLDRDQALALCRGLDMDHIDGSLVERIFEDSGSTETTVGEFFDRLNASLTSTVEEATREASTTATADHDEGDDEEALDGELVLQAWQRAGVHAPRSLQAALGGARPRELERALHAELRALGGAADARAPLLAAAQAMARLRLERVRRRADAATAERDKLRADVAEANRRAQLLALEVDESNTRIETELKSELRRAEVRHADAVRQAAVEVTAERERAASERARFEAELARRSDAEAGLRAEADEARRRANEMAERAALAERRATELESERARLAAELREAVARAQAPAPDPAAGAAPELAQLRRDNRRLRDRVDELCAALEARDPAPPAPAAAGHLSAELDTLPGSDHSKSCLAQLQTDRADALRRALADAEDSHELEKQKLTDLIKELEGSLELMRAEFDTCEEYWSGKLRSERAALAAEQAAGDARLADLAARVLDYERQFAAQRLPAIEERHSLEAQFADLEGELARSEAARAAAEAEAERLAAEAEQMRAEAERLGAEAERLASQVAELEAQLAAAARQHTARELRARTGRAEAAARRLAARLAAADLLVKELYVENCQLAQRAL